MGWGTRVHRPSSAALFGGRAIYHRARIVLTRNVVRVYEPMAKSTPVTKGPTFGLNLRYATDLYHRIYVADVARPALEKTITFEGKLYSAPLTDGNIPGESATWSEVVGSEIGPHLADYKTRHEQVDPNALAGLDFVDIWTSVYQDPDYWTSEFTVIHELWGNLFRWTRVPTEEISHKPFGFSTERIDTRIHLGLKEQG